MKKKPRKPFRVGLRDFFPIIIMGLVWGLWWLLDDIQRFCFVIIVKIRAIRESPLLHRSKVLHSSYKRTCLTKQAQKGVHTIKFYVCVGSFHRYRGPPPSRREASKQHRNYKVLDVTRYYAVGCLYAEICLVAAGDEPPPYGC